MLKIRLALAIIYIFALSAVAQAQDSDSVTDSSFVIVDNLAKRLEVSLSWMDERFGQNDFWLSLRSPSGKIIDENNSDPQVEVINTGTSLLKAYRIAQPEPGAWEAIVRHPAGVEYFCGDIINSDLIMDWNFVNPTPKILEPIIIEAYVAEPEPVTAVTVTAKLSRYKLGYEDFQEFYLVLSDDGRGDDTVANDGIYTATFTDTSVEGSYCLDVTAEGSTAKAGQFKRTFSKCTVVSNRNPLLERPAQAGPWEEPLN